MKSQLAIFSVVLLAACEDKAPASAMASTATAPSPTPPAASSAPVVAAAPQVSAAAQVPSSAAAQGDMKEVVVTVKDPVAEPQKSVKAALGGTVTLYLPDFPGTVWSVEANDKALGKAKEEVIPGFAPGTNGHQFRWSTSNPLLKSGASHKVSFVNKKAGKPNGNFTLTIEIL